MPEESYLENRLTIYAQSKGIYVRKFTGSPGVPDRIFTRSLTLFLEIKAAGEKPTALQQDEIATICAVEGYATWVDEFDAGIRIIDTIAQNRGDYLRKKCKHHNYWI